MKNYLFQIKLHSHSYVCVGEKGIKKRIEIVALYYSSYSFSCNDLFLFKARLIGINKIRV
ncbi:hypothetical protein EMIT019CA3_30165 [Bacillus pseudomycoides]